jgi:hypothetical protein
MRTYTTFGSGAAMKRLCIVLWLAFMQGDLFKRLIRSGGMLDEKFVAGEVILPMLLTLEHLHARSIYHR